MKATQPIIQARLEEVGHAGEELRVDGQAAVERVPRARNQPHRKLVLEHDDGGAEGRPVRQQLERERRGDLVRDVCHAHVKVRQLHLHDVTLDHLLAAWYAAASTSLQLCLLTRCGAKAATGALARQKAATIDWLIATLM